jgi:cytidylate kinase
MYRAVTLKALRSTLDPHNEKAVARLAEAAEIKFVEQLEKPQRVMLDGEDVSGEIRSADVTSNVSLVSSYEAVREAMVRRQRELADGGGVVLEGRDIGSVVLPCANVKIYLDASIDVRANRRCKEIQQGGGSADEESVRQSIEERDRFDTTREVSPLTIPFGAKIIDTSKLSIDEQVKEVERIAEDIAEQIAAITPPKGARNPLRRRRLGWRLVQLGAELVLRVVWGLRIVRKDKTDYLETYIYACNHRSNLDPPVFGSTVQREIHFVAKRSLFKNKLFGGLISYLNSVPIRRGRFDRDAMDRFVDLLRNDRSVLIFPEGGRVRGHKLGVARAGIGYLALKSGRPVVPVYIEGTNHLGRAFLRNPPITLIQGRPMRFTDPDLERYQEKDQFREFGGMVMAAIGAIKDEHEKARGLR